MNTGRGRNWYPNNRGRGFPMPGPREFRGNTRGMWRSGNSFRGGRPFINRGGRWGRNDYRSPQRYQKPDLPTKRLSEKDIGVTEYVSSNEGFTGIIKFRYSDFQVSEINEKGEVAKLTSLEPLKPPEEVSEIEDDDTLFTKYDPEILPLETWDKINALVMTPKPTAQKVEVDVTNMSKEERTKIHNAVKKVFTDTIVGSTVTVGEKKFVTFERYRRGIRVDNRTKWIWPHEYLYFIVHKENCDTMEASQRIAQRLRIHAKTSLMGYAGTKDRRAKTSQWFSVRKFNPKKVADFCKHLDGIHVGNFSFAPEPLKLGMLKGNRFRIALRNIVAPAATVEESCSSLKERGFINYYGLQRFGTNVTVPTYEIGIKLLKQDFRGAIDCILSSRSSNRDKPESNLQFAIERNPKDMHGALNQIPRNIRLLYLHSYQSLVWNRCVSERIKRHGFQLCVGDLVPEDKDAVVKDDIEEQSDNESDTEEDQTQEANADPTNMDTENAANKESDISTTKETDNSTNKEIESETSKDTTSTTVKKDRDEGHGFRRKYKNYITKEKLKVKVLTQEDIDEGNYSIFDLVLPLPGHEIVYPPNMIDYYTELMTKDGLTLELKSKMRTYSMGGTYRNVIARVGDMHWSEIKYSNGVVDLLRSDIDVLKNKPEFVPEPDGRYRALVLEFSLPASSYATMALRELMKIDTACDFQAAQNDYHKKPPITPKEDAVKKETTTQHSNNTSSEANDEASEVSNEASEVNNEASEENKVASEMECDEGSENGAEKRKLDVSEDGSAKKPKQDDGN